MISWRVRVISRILSDPGLACTQVIRAFSVLDFLRAKEVREMETMENINRHPRNKKRHQRGSRERRDRMRRIDENENKYHISDRPHIDRGILHI